MDESRAVEERWDQQREAGARFGFGRNWTRFQRTLSPEQIASARESMAAMLEQTSLAELRFLDAGCGSGLFSLCARQLGADVVSFDFDPESVACTQRVQQQHALDDPHWRVLQGSILNPAFVASLGQFDVVYAWGVLHHTGRMNDALANAVLAVKPGGRLFISVYNDQGSISRYWWQVKRAYNRYPLLKPFIIAAHAPHLFGARVAYRALRGRKLERGMSIWHDMVDWLGGFPFEVARPEQIVRFYKQRGFDLLDMTTCGGSQGCNEFVFRLRAPRG